MYSGKNDDADWRSFCLCLLSAVLRCNFARRSSNIYVYSNNCIHNIKLIGLLIAWNSFSDANNGNGLKLFSVVYTLHTYYSKIFCLVLLVVHVCIPLGVFYVHIYFHYFRHTKTKGKHEAEKNSIYCGQVHIHTVLW